MHHGKPTANIGKGGKRLSLRPEATPDFRGQPATNETRTSEPVRSYSAAGTRGGKGPAQFR